MKRKFLMAVIAVLVLCLTCGMLLVACNDDKKPGDEGNNPPPPTKPVTSVEAFNTVMDLIVGSYKVSDAKKMGIDVDVELGVDESAVDGEKYAYGLIAKGNINVLPEANPNNQDVSEIYLAFTQKRGDATEATPLFELGYSGGYFYLSCVGLELGEQKYLKIDAFSLAELAADIIARTAPDENAGTEADGGIIDVILNLLKQPGGLLFDSEYNATITKNEDGSTTYDMPGLDLSGLNQVGDLVKRFLTPSYVKVDGNWVKNSGATAASTDAVLQIIGGFNEKDTLTEEDKATLDTFASIAGVIDNVIKELNIQNPAANDAVAQNLPDVVNCLFGWLGRISGEAEITINADGTWNGGFQFDYKKDGENLYGEYDITVNSAYVGDKSVEDVFAKSGINEVIADKDYPTISLLNFALDGTAELLNADKTEVVGRYTISVDADINPFPLLKLLKGTDKENISAILKQLGYLSVVVDEVDEKGGFVQNIITIYSDFASGSAFININAYSVMLMGSSKSDISLGSVYDFDALIDMIGIISATSAAESDETETPSEGIDIVGLLMTIIGYVNFNDGFTLQIDAALTELVNALGAGSMLNASNLYLGAETLNVKVTSSAYGECNRVDFAELSAVTHRAETIERNEVVNKDRAGSGASGLLTDITGIGVGETVYDASAIPDVGDLFVVEGTYGADKTSGQMTGKVIARTGFDASKIGEKQTVTIYFQDGAHKGSGLFGLLGAISGKLNLPAWLEDVVFGIQSYTFDVTLSDDLSAETNYTDNFTDEIKVIKGAENWLNGMSDEPFPAIIIDGTKYPLTIDNINSVMKDETDVTAEFKNKALNVDAGEYKITFIVGKKLVTKAYDLKVTQYELSTQKVFFGNTFNHTQAIVIDGVSYWLMIDNGAWVAQSDDGAKLDDLESVELVASKSGEVAEFTAEGRLKSATAEKAHSGTVYYNLTVKMKSGLVLTKDSLQYGIMYGFAKRNQAIGTDISKFLSSTSYSNLNYTTADNKLVNLSQFGYDDESGSFYFYYENNEGAQVKAEDIKIIIEAYENIDGAAAEVPTADVIKNGCLNKAGSWIFVYTIEYKGSTCETWQEVSVDA